MDGELGFLRGLRGLTGEPSDYEKLNRLTDVFNQEFPYYLAMGMTSTEFWDGDPALAKAYRKADELRRERRNEDDWRLGGYFYEGLMSATLTLLNGFSKQPISVPKYPTKPHPLTEEDAKREDEERRKAAFNRMLAKMEAESARNEKLEAKEVNPSVNRD